MFVKYLVEVAHGWQLDFVAQTMSAYIGIEVKRDLVKGLPESDTAYRQRLKMLLEKLR